MNIDATLALAIGVMVFIFINVFFNIRFFEGLRMFFLNLFDGILDGIGKYNTKRYIERRKKEAIVINKENLISKYNRFVENFIIDFELPLTGGYNTFVFAFAGAMSLAAALAVVFLLRAKKMRIA